MSSKKQTEAGSAEELSILERHRRSLYGKLCPGDKPWAFKQKYCVRIGVRELLVFAEDETAARTVARTFEDTPVRVIVFPHMNVGYGQRPTYKDKDIAQSEFQSALAEAKQLWAQLCAEYSAFIGGDGGSFTSGAGIAIDYIAPRRRQSAMRNVIEDYEAYRSQQCAVHEATRDEVIAFLSRKGIVTYWNCGWSA